MSTSMQSSTPVYSDRLVRHLVRASLIWAVMAVAIGVAAGLQLVVPGSQLSPELAFGRIRPVHLYAMVFGFAGNLVFAGMYYASQRLLAVSITRPILARVHMIGWQLVVAVVCSAMVMGYSDGDGLLGAPWFGDVAMAALWLILSLVVFDMVRLRRHSRLFVSMWSFMAVVTVMTVAHVTAALAATQSIGSDYALFDESARLIAVTWAEGSVMASLLIVAPIGLMYFYLPAAAQRPLYSYPLAIAQFWPMILLVGFAGLAQLVGSAGPGWLQSLIVVASLLLVAPLFGAALGGLLTLGGTWNRLRTDAALKFFAAATVFLALFALDGALVAMPPMASLSQFTDWMIGHAHLLGMGWFGCLSFAVLYWLVPRLWATPLRYPGLANAHVYLALVGVLVHLSAAWIAGATQGVMWRTQTADGGLVYSFVETLLAIDPLRWARLIGGVLYGIGFVLLIVNLGATARAGQGDQEVIATAASEEPAAGWRWFGGPLVLALVVVALLAATTVLNPLAALVTLLIVVTALTLWVAWVVARGGPGLWHRGLEHRALFMGLLVGAVSLASWVVVVGLAGYRAPPATDSSATGEHSELDRAGRAVYQREGCRSCHSQRVRPFLWESNRYGEVSSAGQSEQVHPSGSRRIGPDLTRIGGRYSDRWHYDHLIDPPAVTYGSNMPSYRHLVEQQFDLSALEPDQRDRARALASELGVPADSHMVALIAYLQSLRGAGQSEDEAGHGDEEALP